jgi:hypothetical protein
MMMNLHQHNLERGYREETLQPAFLPNLKTLEPGLTFQNFHLAVAAPYTDLR